MISTYNSDCFLSGNGYGNWSGALATVATSWGSSFSSNTSVRSGWNWIDGHELGESRGGADGRRGASTSGFSSRDGSSSVSSWTSGIDGLTMKLA